MPSARCHTLSQELNLTLRFSVGFLAGSFLGGVGELVTVPLFTFVGESAGVFFYNHFGGGDAAKKYADWYIDSYGSPKPQSPIPKNLGENVEH